MVRTKPGRVFISSTCYDLVDLRAEVASMLASWGLIPVLSDRPDSEFQVLPGRDSIEVCLENLRTSAVAIVILSQRYGASLAKTGYPDLSATHLEYRTAVELGLPIYVYVRDRLDAERSIWVKNGKPEDMKFPWCQDTELLKLVNEHKDLVANSPKGNWYWTFRDSLELKTLIAKDLQALAGNAFLQRLVSTGKLPVVAAELKRFDLDNVNQRLILHILLRNVGEAAALRPFVTVSSIKDEPGSIQEIPILAPGEDYEFEKEIYFRPEKGEAPLSADDAREHNFYVEATYSSVEGHVLGDLSELHLKVKDRIRISAYKAKRYYHSSGFDIEVFDPQSGKYASKAIDHFG